MRNFSRVCKNKKRKKNHKKRLSFITEFETEYLLMLTSCQKGLGKMSDLQNTRILNQAYLSLSWIYRDIEQPQEKESS